jgi:uncharacterized integral membrane protein
MRTLSAVFWALVAAILVTVGLANRDLVRLRVLPEALSEAVGVAPDIDLPLFMVVFLGFALGILLGLVWEWIREIPERRQARATARELDRLRAEVARLGGRPGERDEVAALLDAPAVTAAALPARR